MVYASTSLALAVIELFVHLEPGQAPDDLVYLSALLPQGEPAPFNHLNCRLRGGRTTPLPEQPRLAIWATPGYERALPWR